MSSPAVESTSLPVTDDLLAEILIRLPTLADVGRACAACRAFHRVITDRSFLRRLRALHPPPLLGILVTSFLPAEPPHPSAAIARAFANAADFDCSFLPSTNRWVHRDFRDGRTLLSAVPKDPRVHPSVVEEFAVCDPLHRRYLLLPAIPDDLAALVHQPDLTWFYGFLAEGATTTSFRVICLAECKSKLVVFTFSSVGGQWHAAEFNGWSALTAAGPGTNPDHVGSELGINRYYVHGCICWVLERRHKLLMLDASTMEFSSIDIPPINPIHPRAVVEAGEGRIGMFALETDLQYGAYYLSYTILRNNGQGAAQWLPEAKIPLPLNYRLYYIIGVAGGYLLLAGIPADLCLSCMSSVMPRCDYFSLNLKTFQVERLCGIGLLVGRAEPYAGFPPSLSPPTI